MPCSARGLRVGRGRLRGYYLCARGGWIRPPRDISKSLRIRSRQSGETLRRLILRLQGRLRWWSHGAFGNKGRLEGSQYLAGRRAPPLLRR